VKSYSFCSVQEIFAVRMMDLQVAIFLLIFLSLSCLATLGICYVEIRSCWRQYRLSIETQRHVFLHHQNYLVFSPKIILVFTPKITLFAVHESLDFCITKSLGFYSKDKLTVSQKNTLFSVQAQKYLLFQFFGNGVRNRVFLLII
jgi:hypothetical protein